MKDVVVIGLGAFGYTVATELSNSKLSVLVIDKDEDKVESISDYVTNAILGDATDIKVLEDAGVQNFDIAIVSVGNDIPASLIITMNLKDLGVKYIYTKAVNNLQAKILRKIGADKIIFPERDSAIKLASSIANPTIFEHIDLSKDYGLVEIIAPKRFIDKTLEEINIRKEYGVNVIAIKRKNPEVIESGRTILNEEVIISPSGSDKIIDGDVLVLIGRYEDLDRINRL